MKFNIIYSIVITKGSVEIKSNIKRVFNVPASVAQAFVNGDLHPVIKNDNTRCVGYIRFNKSIIK